MILDCDTKMYLLEVEKNTGFSGSRKVNSSRGSYGHDYSDDNDSSEEYFDESCKVGSCEGCSEEDCFGNCKLVYTGKKGKDKLFYHGKGKGKCVENTCKKKEDCKNHGHSGFDCNKDGYCDSPCSYRRCSKCAETQCKELDWSCDWKENKCVYKPECKKDADCLKLGTWCHYGDCAEGDVFCNKEGFCKPVVCDPATMGGCEGCSINQCGMKYGKDCLVVGKSGEEKCVSKTCTNSKDCRKLFTKLCDYGDCEEGDLFCNKNSTCERVVCDPSTMGGCEGCSANQCGMMDYGDEKCYVVGKSGEEKCVSKTCTNNKDCRKLDTELCDYGDCVEGDLFCNKEGTCEQVVCDPSTMGGCEGCSANQCRMMEDKKKCLVVGESGEDKCVSNTCTNDKDCRKLFNELCDHGDCVEGDFVCNKEGICVQDVCDPATMGGCEGCSYDQCYKMDNTDCVIIEGKCVSNNCTNNKDCRKLQFTRLCDYGNCVEGDLVCNKEGFCEPVVCDPAAMGGCEGCSAHQCWMMHYDNTDCVIVKDKSGEDKCVSNTCTNNKDCRKLRDDEEYECKNGTCQWTDEYHEDL